MKRGITILLLCACVILMLPGGPAAAEDKLSFISINDTLPPELINCVVNYGGVVYVPYYVFSNYGLGLSYTYFTSASTAYLSSRDKQIFFEMNTGRTYDGDDNSFNTQAILRSGTVYLPLALVCRFFGIQYSGIAGNEYGTILRLTTDAVLDDTELLRAATNLMASYYRKYYEARDQEPAQEPLPPVPTESPEPESHEGDRVTLSFVGLPEDRVLAALTVNDLKSCFFLTREDVRNGPDTVRRLLGEGHSVGVWCGEDPVEDWDRTSALLFEAARACTVMLAGPGESAEACRAFAEERGLVWCDTDYSTATADRDAMSPEELTFWLEEAAGDLRLRLGCDQENAQALERIMNYLRTEKYEIVRPRETDGWNTEEGTP